jgi:hypothetical protein
MKNTFPQKREGADVQYNQCFRVGSLLHRDVEVAIITGINVYSSVIRRKEVGLDGCQVAAHQG